MENNRLHIMAHPLISHKITMMRRKETDTRDFRALVNEVALLIGYEATRELPVTECRIETPLVATTGYVLRKQVCLVPILRAGLGMVDAMLSLVPAAKVGHIGLYRDPVTKEPVEYYCKLPTDVADRDVLVLDPMLATGGSASAAIGFLKQRGCKSIKLIDIIGAPDGVQRVQNDHPDVDIYLGSLDECLNEHAYILPGLGDAGDRLFGTM